MEGEVEDKQWASRLRGGRELSGEHDRLFSVAEGVDGQRTNLFGIRKLWAVKEFMFNLWIKR